MKNYILNGHEPVEEPDLSKWCEWMETGARRVAITKIGGVTISTVFLGMDHNFYGKGPPILFETMVFGNEDSDQDRYRTWDEAEKGHASMIARYSHQTR